MLNSILDLLSATPLEIMDAAEDELTRLGYQTTRGRENLFVFAAPPPTEGVTKVPLLCAHADVVGVIPPKKTDLIFDASLNKISLDKKSKAKVLGADDRAGIFAMFKIVHGLKDRLPFVVITDKEEVGGVGAGAVVDSQFLELNKENISCYIELDRRGCGEVVSYDFSGSPNEDLGEMFYGQGFIADYGSYSDVADFTSQTDTSNVNLSVGYRKEHSKNEVLFLDELQLTVDRVLRMWKDCPTLFTETFEQEDNDRFANWDYKFYGSGVGGYDDFDNLMDSIYMVTMDVKEGQDSHEAVAQYIDALSKKSVRTLMENLEEVVEELYNYGDEVVDQTADALLDLFRITEKEEEEKDFAMTDFPFDDSEAFFTNEQGRVIGRNLNMNLAGGF